MPVYVWRDGHWCDKRTGERMPIPEREGVCAPRAVIGDIEPYRSPVSGDVISGRAAKRDDLKRHECVDARELPSPTGGKFRSAKFAAKHGMPAHMVKEASE